MTISFFLALHRVYTIFYFAFCVYYGGKLKKQLGFDDWLSLIGLEEVVKEHGGGSQDRQIQEDGRCLPGRPTTGLEA